MADNPRIEIQSLSAFRTRLDSARALTSWSVFLEFLRQTENELRRLGSTPDENTLAINGAKFPANQFFLYLPQYFGSNEFIQDFQSSLQPQDLAKIREIISEVIQRRGSALQDERLSAEQRQKVQTDFISDLRYQLETAEFSTEATGPTLPLAEALSALIAGSPSLDIATENLSELKSRTDRLAESYLKPLAETYEKYAKPEIELSETVQSALDILRAQVQEKEGSETEQADRKRRLSEADRAITQSEVALKKQLEEAKKKALQQLQNGAQPAQLLHGLASQYSTDTGSTEYQNLLISTLQALYANDIAYRGDILVAPFAAVLRNLFDDVLTNEYAPSFTETTKATYTQEQQSAKNALESKLAALLGVAISPSEDTADAGGSDDTPEDPAPTITPEQTLTRFNRIWDRWSPRLPRSRAAQGALLTQLIPVLAATGFITAEPLRSAGNLDAFRAVLETQITQLEPNQAETVLQVLTNYVNDYLPEDEQLTDEDEAETTAEPPEETDAETPEEVPDEPSVPLTAPTDQPLTEETATSRLRQGTKLARLNALLVSQAEAEIEQQLLASGYKQEEVDQLLAAYRADLSNMIWTELLGVGGYQALKGTGEFDPAVAELTKVWASAAQTIGGEILLQTNPANFNPNAYAAGVSPEDLARLERKTREIILGSGLTDENGSLGSLVQAAAVFQDPQTFQQIMALAKNPDLIANIQARLDSQLAAHGTNLPQLQQALLQGNFEFLGQIGKIENIANGKAKFQRFTELHEQALTTGSFASDAELKEYTELQRELFPFLDILSRYGDDIYLLLFALEEFQSLQQFIDQSARQERAVARKLPQFTQNRYSYTSSLTTYASPSLIRQEFTVEVEVTEEYEVRLLSDARDNLALKKLIALQIAGGDLAAEQQALELLLADPAAQTDQLALQQLIQNTPSLAFAGPNQLAAIQKNAAQHNKKLQEGQKTAQAAALMKAFVAAKGNPYLMAANLLKSKEGRELVKKMIEKASIAALTGIGLQLYLLYQAFKPLLVILNGSGTFLGNVATGVGNVLSGIGNFIGGIFGGGATGTVAAGLGANTATAAGAAASKAAIGTRLGINQAAQYGRAELSSGLNSFGTQASALLTGTITTETATSVLVVGLLGPFIFIGILTIIVITVIGASLNDLPMTGIIQPGSEWLSTEDTGCYNIDVTSFQNAGLGEDVGRIEAAIVRLMQNSDMRKICGLFAENNFRVSIVVDDRWILNGHRFMGQTGEIGMSSSFIINSRAWGQDPLVYTFAHETSHFLDNFTLIESLYTTASGGRLLESYPLPQFNSMNESAAEALAWYMLGEPAPRIYRSDAQNIDLRSEYPAVYNAYRCGFSQTPIFTDLRGCNL